MMVTMKSSGAGIRGRTIPMWGPVYFGGHQFGKKTTMHNYVQLLYNMVIILNSILWRTSVS